MARSRKYSILRVIILFCCLRNLLGSRIRNAYNERIQSPSFSCLPTANATSSFQSHVNPLLSDFNVKSSLLKFYYTSIGSTPDTVYGYFICRYDMSYLACNICILKGTEFVKENSCEHTDGILFSAMCVFRYSNQSMYGIRDPQSVATSDYIEANVSNYKQYNRMLSPTLEAVIDEAAFGKNKSEAEMGFATMEANVTINQKIYSLGQCTPDIVGKNCNRCLHSALSTIRSSADESPGAISVFPKCQLRYDNISFYHLGESNKFRSSHLIALCSFLVLLVFVY